MKKVMRIKDKGIKISPKYYQKDWKELDLNKNCNESWDKAYKILKDRIYGRYFNQIETLDKNLNRNIGTFSGFAIMSIACLLIETIEQFYNGNIQNSRNGKKPNDISNDALIYHNFFQRSEIFKDFFDSIEKSNIFYIKIRCGLLHQGQTKGKSLIHIRKDEDMLSWIDKNNLSINRRKFIQEVESVFKTYLFNLKKMDLNKRKKIFKRKMDYIVDLK